MQTPSSGALWRIAIGVMLIAPWAFLLWTRFGPSPEIVYSDGISVRVPAEKAAGRTIVWDRPEPFEIPDAAGDDFSDPAFAPDGSSIVFTRDQAGKDNGLWISRQLPDQDGWSNPTPIAALESPADEMGAAWSPDGTQLYFVSNRPGGEGGYDIWLSKKTGDVWAAPVNAGPSVNSEDDETGPAVTAAGDVLYFASNREGKNLDIYSVLIGSSEPAAPVDSLNSAANDGQVAFTRRGDFAYFSSDRFGGRGGLDLYRARWRDGRFETPVNLGETINSWADEMDPSLALEGFMLAFSSDRGSGPLPLTGKPLGIFFTVSREVDVAENRSGIGLEAALARFYDEWRGVLLWLGLALAGYLILAVVQRASSAEPSLTQRCFAISLLVHVALLGIFAVWTLTETILEDPPDPAMEVGVNADSLAAEKLATEIRQNISALPAVEPPAPAERFAPPPDFAPAEAPGPAAPALPEAERPEGPPVDPSFQIAELAEVTPILAKALPGVPVIAAGDGFEFAIVKPVLDIGGPALAAENAKLEPPSDAAGNPRPPSEPQLTLGMPVVEEVPSEEADPRTTPLPVMSASPTPDSAGNLAPSSTAKVPAPTVAILIDPLASTGLDLRPRMLEIGAAQPPEVDPGQNLAPISDVVAVDQTRQTELPNKPQTDASPGASLNLESPVNEPGLLVMTAAVANERAASQPGASLPNTDTTGPALIALPQMLDFSEPPRLESPKIAEDPYLLRDPKIRNRVIEELGGNADTEKAIRQALDWFTRNQEADGHWNVQRFGGQPGHDVAGTSLVLLSYMGWGANHRDPGPHHAQVKRAVTWLLSQMKDDGDLRGWNETALLGNMYDQGMATMALAEAYGMTKDEGLREPVEKAVAFIVAGQDPAAGSWRYRPFPEERGGDTSIFGWQVMALRSAQLAGVDVPAVALTRCDKWLNTIGGGKSRGLYGYRDANPKPAMVAEGLFCQQLLGKPAADPKMRESVQFLGANLPATNQVFFYYWYYAQLALYQNKGPVWEDWNAQMQTVLLPSQHPNGGNAGSWDPAGQYGPESGRVIVTAMATLTLEVYYRYLPLYDAME